MAGSTLAPSSTLTNPQSLENQKRYPISAPIGQDLQSAFPKYFGLFTITPKRPRLITDMTQNRGLFRLARDRIIWPWRHLFRVTDLETSALA